MRWTASECSARTSSSLMTRFQIHVAYLRWQGPRCRRMCWSPACNERFMRTAKIDELLNMPTYSHPSSLSTLLLIGVVARHSRHYAGPCCPQRPETPQGACPSVRRPGASSNIGTDTLRPHLILFSPTSATRVLALRKWNNVHHLRDDRFAIGGRGGPAYRESCLHAAWLRSARWK